MRKLTEYCGMKLDQANRLKELEAENARLKRADADHWITKYNEELPHDALQGMTSVKYLEAQIMQKTLETYGPNYGTYKICPGNKRTG